MAFFSRKSLQEKNDEDRMRIIDDLQDALKVPQMTRVHHAIISLAVERHIGHPEVPFIINGAIESVAQRDLDKGIGLALYALSHLQSKFYSDPHGLLTDKAFSLIARADRTDMKQMAGVAMLAQTLVLFSDGSSENSKRALKEWQKAFDTLAADKGQGIQYAFAAASNASLQLSSRNTMQGTAMAAWEKAVNDLARTDKQAAIKEAKRVAEGYELFGLHAEPFRTVAHAALKKISP